MRSIPNPYKKLIEYNNSHINIHVIINSNLTALFI